jgi:hypothetical protein
MPEQQQSVGPWFVGAYFVAGHERTCAVCGQSIRRGQSAVADYETKQCAHLGCGRVEQRRRR